MLTPKQLEQILAIAEFGTFNQAAGRLNLSQPALTASIAKLEDRLGFSLFLRNKRGAEPTIFGRHIIDSAPEILSRLGRLQDELGLLAGAERGALRLAAGPVLIHGALRQVIPRFCRDYPNIQISVQTSAARQIAADVAAGRVDLGIGAIEPDAAGPELILRQLHREPMQIGVRPGHPLAGRAGLTLTDILAYPLALPEVPRDIQLRLDALAGQEGVRPRRSLTTDHYDLIFQTVQSSDLLTGAPRHLLAPHLAQDSLVALPLPGPLPHWQAVTAYREVSALSPAFTALLDMLQDWFAAVKDPSKQA